MEGRGHSLNMTTFRTLYKNTVRLYQGFIGRVWFGKGRGRHENFLFPSLLTFSHAAFTPIHLGFYMYIYIHGQSWWKGNMSMQYGHTHHHRLVLRTRLSQKWKEDLGKMLWHICTLRNVINLPDACYTAGLVDCSIDTVL